MLKIEFKNQQEFEVYRAEQKVRMEKGFLTVAERNQLNYMLSKQYKPKIIKEEKKNPNIKSIITSYKELRKPCQLVEPSENISQILKELKETCMAHKGLGLSANQIGYNKKISYVRIPIQNPKTRKTEIKESYIINAKIVEKDNPTKVKNEECLSLPGLSVITKRYVFVTIEAEDEHRKKKTYLTQDLEALVMQHEINHQQGITILERKWTAK